MDMVIFAPTVEVTTGLGTLPCSLDSQPAFTGSEVGPL
jgi:hypothetical protein